MGRQICGILVLLPTAVMALAQQQQINNALTSGGVSFGSLLTDNIDANSEMLNGASRRTHDVNDVPKWQYWCDSCACGFNKMKSFKEHTSAKLHIAVVGESDNVWEEYLSSGPALLR